MKDYSFYAIVEAVQEQIASQFIYNIKQMDIDMAERRLATLIKGNKPDTTFLDIAGQFNSLIGCKTSVDEG